MLMWQAHPMQAMNKTILRTGINLTVRLLFYGQFIHGQKFTGRHYPNVHRRWKKPFL